MPHPDGASPRRADVVGVAVLAATPVLVETLAGYVRGGFDLGWFFLPLWEWWFARPRFLGGWNPWLFGGFPSGSDPQLAVLHPFTFLHALLPGLVATALEGVLVPAVAAVGMQHYLARLGCGRVGSAFGALSFALGGYVTAHAPHPGIVRAAMLVPWGLLAIESLDGRRLVAGLGLAVGLILLGGHPQVGALAAVLLLLYALCLGRVRASGRLLALAGGFVLGALVGAAVWLPALALVPTTTRALGGPVFPDPTLAAADLPSLLLPLLQGGGIGPLAAPVRSAFACGPVECTGYPGLLAWIVVLAGLLVLLRDAHGRFWLAVATLALVAATGALPLPTGVRGAARILLWWNVALAAAAGIAVGRVLRGEVGVRALAGAWLGLATAVAVLALTQGGSGTRLSGALAVALAGLALGMLARRPGDASASPWLVGALAADLLVFASTLAPAAVRPEELARVRAPAVLVRAIVDEPACQVPADARVLLLTPFAGIDAAQVARVATVQGYNPLVPQNVALLLGQTGAGLEAVGHVDDVALAADGDRALDLLRVALVVRDVARPSALGDAIAAAAARGDGRWQLAPCVAPAGLALFVNRRARPVAWLAGGAQEAGRDAAIARVRGAGDGLDPERTVLIEHGALQGWEENAFPKAGDRVQVVSRDDDKLELDVEVANDVWLVTSEVVAAGWSATIDGAPVSINIANGGFRAVPVPSGAHTVRFSYRPLVSWLALLLSMVGLVVAAVIGTQQMQRAAT